MASEAWLNGVKPAGKRKEKVTVETQCQSSSDVESSAPDAELDRDSLDAHRGRFRRVVPEREDSDSESDEKHNGSKAPLMAKKMTKNSRLPSEASLTSKGAGKRPSAGRSYSRSSSRQRSMDRPNRGKFSDYPVEDQRAYAGWREDYLKACSLDRAGRYLWAWPPYPVSPPGPPAPYWWEGSGMMNRSMNEALILGTTPRRRLSQDSRGTLCGDEWERACRHCYHCEREPEVEERLQRLEGDKDTLQMQVSVLMDQIEAQTEKISELEKNLTEKSNQLGRAEEMLQKELLSRSSAETHKLELISEISNIKLRYAALERENLELKGQLKRSEQDMLNLVGQCYSLFGSVPGFKKEMLDTLRQNVKSDTTAKSPASPVIAAANPDNSNRSPVSLPVSSSAAPLPSNRTVPSPASNKIETRQPYIQASKTPPASTFRKIEPFNSLPRQREAWAGKSASPSVQDMLGSPSSLAANANSTPSRKGVAFGKSLFQPFRGPSSRSCSAPNLAETERRIIEQNSVDTTGEDVSLSRSPLSPTTSHTSNLSVTQQLNKPKGIKKIFGKLKRSNSGSLDGDASPEGDFKRGGVRATAGPRLVINEDTRPFNEPELPFAKWDKDAVCAWLHDIGLHMYVSEAARWVKHGEHLLKASVSELEKDLGVKHPLHRKKLVLALEDRGREKSDHHGERLNGQTDVALEEAASRLDHQWVVRWLDDVGLPQYKDAFLEARVDGRVLHNLTIEDLCQHLKVTNLLHVTSLKRGIQVLRIHKYQPNCLTRRSLPEDQQGSHTVELWTNHRVMEWLRVVDLSEYAPNMRGSGVHGALMVYEPRFTAELLATILSIPVGKTLLRRHLATHFHDLLGRYVVQQKRDAEAQSGYVPLTPIAKVKLTKRSQFTLKRKKSKSEFDFEDLVCPLETSQMTGDKEGTPYEGVNQGS